MNAPRDLGPDFRAWMRDVPEPPADLPARTLAKTRRTRQRRRWLWLLPGRRPSAEALDELDDDGPAVSIATADEFAPAPVKGTRTMFSATKLIAAAAVVALSVGIASTGVLTNQPEQPAGAGSDSYGMTVVSGTGSFYGAENAMGSSEMDDPRVSGDWDITQHLHCAPAGSYTCAKWGQATMANDGGTWEGEWVGLHHPGNTELGLHYITVWMTGTGEHEGLNYVATLMGDPAETIIEGVIYEGPLPETVALGAVGADVE